jgi:hypothetical protein
MDNDGLLVVAMARQCRELMEQSEAEDSGVPQALHPNHLLWMCEHIENRAGNWPTTRLHRWIGFVQCGMTANGMLDFDGAKAMFDDAKNAYGEGGGDDDLIDHLNPRSSFKMDIGGEG